MIFTPDEEQVWLAEHIYPIAGVEPLAVDWEHVRQMSEWSMDVQGNTAFLLREVRPDQEVMQYLKLPHGRRGTSTAHARLLEGPLQHGAHLQLYYGQAVTATLACAS